MYMQNDAKDAKYNDETIYIKMRYEIYPLFSIKYEARNNDCELNIHLK